MNQRSIIKERLVRGLLTGRDSIQCDLSSDILNIIDLQFLVQITNEISFREIIVQEEYIHIVSSKEQTIPLPLNHQDWQLALEHFSLKHQQLWNYSNPFVSFNCKLGTKNCRVSLVHYKTQSNNFSKMFIRHISDETFALNDYFSDPLLLKSLIDSKKNILISGATGSGKTSFTNSMLSQISTNEHIIILEDTIELISPNKNTTRFLSQQKSNYQLIDYMKYSMRMAPERIILGELRGAEVVPYLLALNSGHSGCISTIHADNATDSIDRLCLLFNVYSNLDTDFNNVKRLLTKSIDYIVHLEDRKVVEIVKILGGQDSRVFTDTVYSKSEDSKLFINHA